MPKFSAHQLNGPFSSIGTLNTQGRTAGQAGTGLSVVCCDSVYRLLSAVLCPCVCSLLSAHKAGSFLLTHACCYLAGLRCLVLRRAPVVPSARSTSPALPMEPESSPLDTLLDTVELAEEDALCFFMGAPPLDGAAAP